MQQSRMHSVCIQQAFLAAAVVCVVVTGQIGMILFFYIVCVCFFNIF